MINILYLYMSMSIKSSQKLVEEAKKVIETINSEEVKKLSDNGKITLIDIRILENYGKRVL